MIGVYRVVAPLLGACLFATPALAQDFATPPAATVSSDTTLTPAETVWHMRAALNVAALGCRGADGDETVQLYNTMLQSDASPLAEASAGTDRAYKARFASHWQDAEDSAMTRLYNAFASTRAHEAFCATAHDVLREVGTVEPSDFANFAAVALRRLEAPFAPVRPPEAVIASVSTPRDAAQMGDEVTGGGAPSVMAVAYAKPRP
jgi:hypothetical protein